MDDLLVGLMVPGLALVSPPISALSRLSLALHRLRHPERPRVTTTEGELLTLHCVSYRSARDLFNPRNAVGFKATLMVSCLIHTVFKDYKHSKRKQTCLP